MPVGPVIDDPALREHDFERTDAIGGLRAGGTGRGWTGKARAVLPWVVVADGMKSAPTGALGQRSPTTLWDHRTICSSEDRSPELELSEYATALRKRWYIIVLAALVGGGIGFADAKSTTPTYRATAKVFVSPAGGETVGDLVQGSNYAQKLVLSYAELATMPVVLDPVAYRLGLDTSARDLARQVSAETPLDTFIIEISATAESAERSARLADAVASELADTVSALSPGPAGAGVDLSTVSPAAPPSSAFAPNTTVLTAAGLAIGLALGVAAAIAMALLDTRLRTPADIARTTPLPVLGVIPHTRGRAGRATLVLDDPTSPGAEAYRRLQTNLRFIDASGPIRSMVVSSAVPGEGKSTTALNLALAMAEKGHRVLLIDADLRRPTVAKQLGIEGTVGLTTVLIGAASLAEVAQQWGDGVDVLPSGEIPPNPSQLVDSRAMVALLAEATRTYDFVVIDSPPLLPVADAAVLSKMTDGALLVAGCHRVRRPQLAGAINALATVDAAVLGIVATGVRLKSSAAGYAYRSAAPAPAPTKERRRSGSRSTATRPAGVRAAAPEAGRPFVQGATESRQSATGRSTRPPRKGGPSEPLRSTGS